MFGYDKDELWNTVIKTYPAVSQFWTYGKDKFLAQPVYSARLPALQILRMSSPSALVRTQNPGRTAGVFVCWAFSPRLPPAIRLRLASAYASRQRSARERTPAKRGGHMNTFVYASSSRRLLPSACCSPHRSAPAQTQELRIGFLAPRTGHFHPARHRHGQRLPDVSGRARRHARRRQGDLHRRGRPRASPTSTSPRPRSSSCRTRSTCWSARCSPRRLRAGAGFEPAKDALYRHRRHRRRPRAASGPTNILIIVFSTWVPSLPNHPLGQWACEQGYKRFGRHRRRLRLRLRAAWRLPEDLRGLRRQDRAEDLGAARHQGFRALHSDHEADIDAIFTLMVGPMSLQFPKQLRASGNKTLDSRRQHQL